MNPAVNLLLCAALAGATTAQVTMTLRATVNLDTTSIPGNAEFIGSNPAAIAWDGTNLFVAGYNNDNPSNPPQNIGIVKVSNALGTPSLGTAFAVVSTPGFRGYSGLDVSGGTLAAAYDNGSSSPDGISAWDLNGNPLWRSNARGGSGTGFDPGVPGGNPALGTGVGWTTFGSGRRALQDATSGGPIWTTADGMIILPSGSGTFWRDMDFDPATGDIWLRESNRVVTATRVGDNAVINPRVAVALPTAAFVNLQNVAYLATPTGDVVVFNDRLVSTGGQSFDQVMKVVRPDGSPEVFDWGTFSPPTGNAGYDFAWDAASQTLAIVDFANRDAHVFQVDVAPYYAYGSGCAGTGGIVPTLSASGSGQVGSTLLLDVADGVGGGAAFILFGGRKGNLPYAGSCSILVDPLVDVFLGPQVLGGSGAGQGSTQFSLMIPPGTSGVQLALQGAIIDLGVSQPIQIVVTNGVLYRIP